jgi:hypothetical protein
VPVPAFPTFSADNIPSKSLNIPATTPKVSIAKVVTKAPKTPITVQKAVESGAATSGMHYDANTHTLVPN